MATTYSELVTQIRNYTEVDSNVLSDTIVLMILLNMQKIEYLEMLI